MPSKLSNKKSAKKRPVKKSIARNFLPNTKQLSRRSTLMFLVPLVIIGSFLLWRSFASPTKVDTVEAESMQQLKADGTTASLPAYSSTINGPSIMSNVGGASGSKAVRFYTKKEASTSMTLTFKKTLINDVGSVRVVAYGKEYDATCAGKPKLSLVIDNTTVIQPTEVSGEIKFSEYPVGDEAKVSLTKGSQHTVKLIASNIGVKKCSSSWSTRILNVDVINFYGPAPSTTPEPSPAPTPTPTPTPTAGCTGSGTGWNGLGGHTWPTSWLGASCRPYSDDSPFNKPISSPTIHPQSANIITTALANGIGSLTTGAAYGKDYAHPIYYAQANDPLVTLNVGSYAISGRQIRVPAGAQPASGSDHHMSIVQPDGWAYELWNVSSVTSTSITAQIGYRQNYNGLGIVTPAMISADKTIGGTTAPYFGQHAGIIRAQELKAGLINHALFIVISCGSSDTSFGYGVQPPGASGRGGSGSFVYPAFKGDAACSGVRAPMGARFWLNRSSTDIDNTPGLVGWEKTIAKAMNQYGGYMGDTGGPGFGFQFESSTMYTSLGVANPYEEIARSYGLTKDPTWGYTFRPSSAMQNMFKTYLRVVTPPSPN